MACPERGLSVACARSLLYLSAPVLAIVDKQYIGRFHTQAEAYLAMRKLSAEGLGTASSTT